MRIVRDDHRCDWFRCGGGRLRPLEESIETAQPLIFFLQIPAIRNKLCGGRVWLRLWWHDGVITIESFLGHVVDRQACAKLLKHRWWYDRENDGRRWSWCRDRRRCRVCRDLKSGRRGWRPGIDCGHRASSGDNQNDDQKAHGSPRTRGAASRNFRGRSSVKSACPTA